MTTPWRLAAGGLVDRNRPLRFSFDGRSYAAFAGDTIASALLANGVRIAGRSFKLHRPRGIVGAGYEDAGVLVERLSPRNATNQQPTTTPVENGGVYRSINAWPSAAFDVGAVAQGFSRLLPAGFYYKTFMRPSWHWFEPFVRHAAGLGRVPAVDAWQPVSESRHGHTDVLVVGAGAAGLVTALTAARAGLRVMLVDDGAWLGGRLVDDDVRLNDRPAADWIDGVAAELRAMKTVRVLSRSTVWGYHEHNYLTVIERDPPDGRGLHLRHWKIRCRRVVIATGAIERPILFANNDRPGIMQAAAVGSYLGRYGVLCGRKAVVFANTDSGIGVARRMRAAGAGVTVVDPRPPLEGPPQGGEFETVHGHIVGAHGGRGVTAVTIVTGAGAHRLIDCDLVAVSGGWNPAIHLAAQSREAHIKWDDARAMFMAEPRGSGFALTGAANGNTTTAACLADGLVVGKSCVGSLGGCAVDFALPHVDHEADGIGRSIWAVAPLDRHAKVFVDLANDVTTADLGLAVREGFDSIELVKRYTTAGMGVDQGKLSNTNVIAIVAGLNGQKPSSIGTTTFRPPFAPVEFGAIAGTRGGARLYPWRQTPLADWHVANGAVIYEAGLRWQRPGYYRRDDENLQQAAQREARTVREAAGVYDGTPLGKFLLKGPDVPTLLDLLYINDFATLKPERGRYGIMLTEDGLILDDGVTFRLDAATWLLHSSTGAADRVHQHIEVVLNVHRPDLDVSLVPVTTASANATVCGPRARDVLAALQPDFDVSSQAFPFMTMRQGMLGGIPVRVCRVSWTGELSFEIDTSPLHAVELWERIIAAGARCDIAPIGSEANHILRIEAGYISTGHEVDGTADVVDLGLGSMISKSKRDFIGRRSMALRRAADPIRPELVGLLPSDPLQDISEGAPITPGGARSDQEGFVSACVMSPALGRVIALGLLRDGRARIGETVHARVYDRVIPMRVVAPVFHDAERERVKS